MERQGCIFKYGFLLIWASFLTSVSFSLSRIARNSSDGHSFTLSVSRAYSRLAYIINPFSTSALGSKLPKGKGKKERTEPRHGCCNGWWNFLSLELFLMLDCKQKDRKQGPTKSSEREREGKQKQVLHESFIFFHLWDIEQRLKGKQIHVLPADHSSRRHHFIHWFFTCLYINNSGSLEMVSEGDSHPKKEDIKDRNLYAFHGKDRSIAMHSNIVFML